MSGLLVSVRDVEEALAALEGGASLIDVKEPSRGALGKADDAVIRAVIDAVGGRVPVSAAMGELLIEGTPERIEGLAFQKSGVAHTSFSDLYPPEFDPGPLRAFFVPCAYADWREEADAVPPDSVSLVAVHFRLPALLIDTFRKDGRSLLDHLPLADLARIAERCRDAGVKLALAGSLNAEAIRTLRPLRPDWFAVRGAACEGGREGRVSAARVRELAALIASE